MSRATDRTTLVPFLVALCDQMLPPPLYSPLTAAAIMGGLLIIFAFLLLSWATYREMDEEKIRDYKEDIDTILVFVSHVVLSWLSEIRLFSGGLVLGGTDSLTRRVY